MHFIVMRAHSASHGKGKERLCECTLHMRVSYKLEGLSLIVATLEQANTLPEPVGRKRRRLPGLSYTRASSQVCARLGCS
jgi:hypothetical protein